MEPSLPQGFTAAAAAKSLQSCPTLQPHRRQPTRLPRPWDSPGKNTGVGHLEYSHSLCKPQGRGTDLLSQAD